jgi:hypothetical protein
MVEKRNFHVLHSGLFGTAFEPGGVSGPVEQIEPNGTKRVAARCHGLLTVRAHRGSVINDQADFAGLLWF